MRDLYETQRAMRNLRKAAMQRGVVAVLDRRLATSRSYRLDLLETMPPMARTSDPAEVVAFLEGL